MQVTEPYIRVSEAGASIRDAVRLPAHLRKPVGHEKGLLDHYEPNVTYYPSQELRQALLAMGSPPPPQAPYRRLAHSRTTSSTSRQPPAWR